ncbi:hypothetical protein CB0940_01427 [Cercospora beticola]|uniref:UBA domain-containing protein n=1 Tax=Cercospora beticola TaxID=122368 RepID=A0A2G5IAM7_CERBT|nr:hypothetical protein CB0940_01427 [Cercospora beticola]PIB01732.1 hypothetical protein CB0940_01427 [Cercospora beticola]WPA96865.1 hypothetical protein RHO25_001473 [Cercospora beticola]
MMSSGLFQQSAVDGAAPAIGDSTPATKSVARRSISIFSRRGADDLFPPPLCVASSAVSVPTTALRRSWNGKRPAMPSFSTTRERSKRSSAKGTVLHAVPAAKVIEMTALEEKMATSPNEEILSAISDHLPAAKHIATRSSYASKPTSFRRSNPPSPTKMRSRRRSDTDHRIGTWIDGVAYFDQSPIDDQPARHIADLDASRSSIPAEQPIPFQFPEPMKVKSTPILAHPMPRRIISMPSATAIPSRLKATRSMTPEAQSGCPRASSHRSYPSQSSSSSKSATDESSVYSRCSSATTLDTIITADQRTLLSPSKFSLVSPTQAGVFDDVSPRSSVSFVHPVDFNKALPPIPAETPSPRPVTTAASPPAPLTKSLTSARNSMQKAEILPARRSLADLRLSRLAWRESGTISPTLSQAEFAVRDQLSEMTKMRPAPRSIDEAQGESNVRRGNSVKAVMQPPALPKRSRKRDWRAMEAKAQRANVPAAPARRQSFDELPRATRMKSGLPLRRMASFSHNHARSEPMVALPRLSEREVSSQHDAETLASPISSELDRNDVPSSPNAAEIVLLNILCSLSSLTDLRNTAIINKGMYRIYKQHEMRLVQTVVRNISMPAHERQEWIQSQDVTQSPELSIARPRRTPRTYLSHYRNDLTVIRQIKALVHERCQTFIRRETTFALSTPTHPHSQRFDDALWRIWCFCTIFGSRKGREDDITGQLDWLKGGVVNEHEGCAATVNTNLEFDMSSVLLNAPEHFATANRGGLTAAQLYDITEMWTCLSSLLQGYSGRVDQAREYGVYDNCDVAPGDIYEEERFLEEWLAHILTLGPSVVLELALLASDHSPAGFALAKQNGWTEWSLPVYNSSFNNFLKEPVAIVYSEQIAAAKLQRQDPREQEAKEMSRKRVASMAAEIRLRRQTSEYRRLPLIGMDDERPMSVLSRVSSVSTSSRGTAYSAYAPTAPSQRSFGTSSSAFPSTITSRPSISPILEYETQQHSLPDGVPLQSCDLALRKLVELGFPVTLSREALRVTDDGGSVRVDRAIDYLLRQRRQ